MGPKRVDDEFVEVLRKVFLSKDPGPPWEKAGPYIRKALETSHIENDLKSLEDTTKSGFLSLTEEIRGMRHDLVSAVAGKKQMPHDVAMTVIGTLCSVIVALIVWFTGIEPSLPSHAKALTETK